MFLINSRFSLASATTTSSQPQGSFTRMAPLLPKLRGHFAEFLNHDSLDHLSILYLTTCVGYRVRATHTLTSMLFSAAEDHQITPPLWGAHQLSHYAWGRICLPPHATTLDHDYHRVAWLPFCVTPHAYRLHTQVLTRPPTRHPKTPRVDRGVSLMCFGIVGCVSVPEYQLVVHRLRLSASP